MLQSILNSINHLSSFCRHLIPLDVLKTNKQQRSIKPSFLNFNYWAPKHGTMPFKNLISSNSYFCHPSSNRTYSIGLKHGRSALKATDLRSRSMGGEELPLSHVRATAERCLPMSEWGQRQPAEEQLHVQGVVAAWVQEGWGGASYTAQGQEGRQLRRYTSSKLRSCGCSLLEQP